MRRGIAIAIALLTIAADAHPARAAEQRTGRVTHVLDGDTVDILVDRERLRVRLAGVTAPAPNEPFGLRSRQSLVQLCGGEIATVELRGKDRNGRATGRVVCAGTDANAEQVRRGLARVSERDAVEAVGLAAIQDQARAAHRGLWSVQPALSASPNR